MRQSMNGLSQQMGWNELVEEAEEGEEEWWSLSHSKVEEDHHKEVVDRWKNMKMKWPRDEAVYWII